MRRKLMSDISLLGSWWGRSRCFCSPLECWSPLASRGGGVTVAGVFVGLFAGGALGALVALRVEQAREA